MERAHGRGTEFSDVDASGRPAEMIAYLDGVTRFISDGKRASYLGLGLEPSIPIGARSRFRGRTPR